MIPFIIQRSLVSLYLLTTTVMAGWMNSPMSWSPDGEWLAYTIAAGPARDDHVGPGWLFDTGNGAGKTRGTRGVGERKTADAQASYQIWASHRNHEPSVLIEESRWPLTASSWSPRGKSIAFGRFVPQSMDPNQPGQRGRFEVVMQSSLNRKRLLWASPEFELDDEIRASFPQIGGAWSPDGRYLAFSRPGREPSIVIIATDSGKLLATLEHATQPAWSPDGSQCAFIRTKNDSNNLCLVERHGQILAPTRPFIETGSVKATPGWSTDGQSIFVVAERITSRSRELELVRVSAQTGEWRRELSLVAEPTLRGASLRGVVIDFDRDDERCIFSVDIEGRESEVGEGNILRDQQIPPSRFPVLDSSLRVGALAICPKDRRLAIRFGPPGSLTPPALYDVDSGQTTLIVADETAKRQWLSALIGASRNLLISGLPQVTADGRPGQRPTLLPLPGELAATEGLKVRLARFARLASSLCEQPPHQRDDPEQPEADSLANETRLFFAYLQDDFRAAASDLDALEPQIVAPENRLSLLSLRAQILWSQGQHTRAQGMIDYLATVGGGYTKRVEETPSGFTETVDGTPTQVWNRYLTARAAEAAASQSHSRPELPGEMLDFPMQNPFAAPDAPQLERGGGNPRFAPIFQGAAAKRD